MSDEQITPMPGKPVQADNAAHIISNFRNRYSINTEGKHPQIPIWCTIPEEFSSKQVDKNIFDWSPFSERNLIYFYNEYGPYPKLYEAIPSEIQQFFRDLQPWEIRDYYIFDQSLNWCIIVTHDDIVLSIGL